MTNETGKATLPPYVSFRAFFNFLTYLEEGVPQRIDRSVWGKHYNGATGTQLLAGLRFLGLTEGQSNIPTPRLERLVEEKTSRKQLLGELLRDSYAPVFTYVGDLHKATPSLLDEAFRKQYSLRDETLRKAISFFVHAAKEAEIPISKLITEKSRTRSVPTRGSARTNGKKARQNGTSREVSQPHEAPREDVPFTTHRPTNTASGSVKTITLRKGESLTLTYSGDMFHIDKNDRDLVLRLIDLMDSHVQEMPSDDLYDGDEEE